MSTKVFLGIIVFCSLVLANRKTRAQNDIEVEKLRLEAHFIERFTHFITWPESLLPESDIFVIGIYGENDILPILEQIVERKMYKRRKIVVKKVNSLQEINDLQILYVPENFLGQVTQLVDKSAKHGLLTISNKREFAKEGIHIAIYQTNKAKLRFDINYTEFKKTGLRMEYKLVELAVDTF